MYESNIHETIVNYFKNERKAFGSSMSVLVCGTHFVKTTQLKNRST